MSNTRRKVLALRNHVILVLWKSMKTPYIILFIKNMHQTWSIHKAFFPCNYRYFRRSSGSLLLVFLTCAFILGRYKWPASIYTQLLHDLKIHFLHSLGLNCVLCDIKCSFSFFYEFVLVCSISLRPISVILQFYQVVFLHYWLLSF